MGSGAGGDKLGLDLGKMYKLDGCGGYGFGGVTFEAMEGNVEMIVRTILYGREILAARED